MKEKEILYSGYFMETYMSIYGNINNPLIKFEDLIRIIGLSSIMDIKFNYSYKFFLTLEEAYDFLKKSRRWSITKKFKEWVTFIIDDIKTTDKKEVERITKIIQQIDDEVEAYKYENYKEEEEDLYRFNIKDD